MRCCKIFELKSNRLQAGSSIPSESSIKVAKERRERLRTTAGSGEEDFISLSLTRRSEDLGPHPESRLVREDDELGEGDDGISYSPFFASDPLMGL